MSSMDYAYSMLLAKRFMKNDTLSLLIKSLKSAKENMAVQIKKIIIQQNSFKFEIYRLIITKEKHIQNLTWFT